MTLDLLAVGVPKPAPPYPAEEGHLALEVGNYQGAAAYVVVSGDEATGGGHRSRLRFDSFRVLVLMPLKVIEGGWRNFVFPIPFRNDENRERILGRKFLSLGREGLSNGVRSYRRKKRTSCSPNAAANEEHFRNHGFWIACAPRQYSRNAMRNRTCEHELTQL